MIVAGLFLLMLIGILILIYAEEEYCETSVFLIEFFLIGVAIIGLFWVYFARDTKVSEPITKNIIKEMTFVVTNVSDDSTIVNCGENIIPQVCMKHGSELIFML